MRELRILKIVGNIFAIAALSYFCGSYIYFSGYNKGILEGYEACKTEQKEIILTSFVNEITFCESSGKHNGVWGAAGEYGVAQFKKSTFNWMKIKANKPNLRWDNRADQIELLTWAVENGYAKEHWRTCYQKAEKKTISNFIQWKT